MTDDIVLGSEDAPATLIEYASVTSSHCRTFHSAIWPRLKANYIDRNLLRFVFREMDFPFEGFSAAAFQFARCGQPSADVYMERVTAVFAGIDDLMTVVPAYTSPSGDITAGNFSLDGFRQNLGRLGRQFGLSGSDVLACTNAPGAAERIGRLQQAGIDQYQLTGVPTLILNGQELALANDDYDGLARAIDLIVAGRH